MTRSFYVSCGDLHDYQTGRRVRAATRAEERASIEASRHDGGAGAIGAGDLSRPVSGRTLRRAGVLPRTVRS